MNDAAGAINRAYYAAFYAASAALRSRNAAPKSHKGVLLLFHKHFIQTEKLPEPMGAVLRLAFDARQQADYDAFTLFEIQAALDLITDVEAFVGAVEAPLTPPA